MSEDNFVWSRQKLIENGYNEKLLYLDDLVNIWNIIG